MKFIYFSLMTWLLVACNDAPAVRTDVQTQNASSDQTAAKVESETSEGVVGPDDAYFAGVYLASVFNASKHNPKPSLDSSLSLNKEKAVEAFDFAANLQPKRLTFMSQVLMGLGDKDKDGFLNPEEFAAVQLIPELQGSPEGISHEFDKDVFEDAAGDDQLLSRDEIKDLLVKISSQCQLAKLNKVEMRKILELGWEKVLLSFDEDHNGKVSLEEQKKLRKERAKIISRFAGQ